MLYDLSRELAFFVSRRIRQRAMPGEISFEPEGSGFCRILMMLTRKSEDESVFARRSVSFCHKTREVRDCSKKVDARAAKPPLMKDVWIV